MPEALVPVSAEEMSALIEGVAHGHPVMFAFGVDGAAFLPDRSCLGALVILADLRGCPSRSRTARRPNPPSGGPRRGRMRDRPLAQITRHTPASMTRHVTTWLADAYPGLAQDATILPHRTDDGRWEITVVDRAGAIVDAPGGDLTAYVHPPSARNDWRWAIEGLA